MLTFIVYFLLKNPEALRKLREEVDTKIGDRPVNLHDVNKLPYLLGKLAHHPSLIAHRRASKLTWHILAVMRESLRLGPTASTRTAAPIEDTVLVGKYFVEKDTSIVVNTWTMQRDPKVWGEDVCGISDLGVCTCETDRGAGRPIPSGAYVGWQVRGTSGPYSTTYIHISSLTSRYVAERLATFRVWHARMHCE